MRKKAERLAAVEAERDMLEKQLDDVVLERDTIKKDCAEADKTIAALESKLTQKEDAIALVAAKDKEIEKMKEARAKEKIDEANEKMNLRRQSAERAKTKSPTVASASETQATLRFAKRAKHVELGRAGRNVSRRGGDRA